MTTSHAPVLLLILYISCVLPAESPESPQAPPATRAPPPPAEAARDLKYLTRTVVGGGKARRVVARRLSATRPRASPARAARRLDAPHLSVSSAELVEIFKKSLPRNSHLPPVYVPGRAVPPAPAPLCGSPAPPPELEGAPLASPAIPRFQRSLSLRGRLTLPRAGFTEFYNASWHAGSGSMRVDFYDGATSVFRVVNGSKIYRLERRLERAGDAPLLRCAAMTQDAAAASPFDLAPPAIPELSRFTFAGYVRLAGARAERWTRTETGGAGELGGARGEALVHRHEMLLVRADDDFITPIEYSVSVDSSVLGPDCDGYVHRYEEVRAQEPAPGLLRAERGACDALESTADLARVDPLREFTLPARDPRHDDQFASFVSRFKRRYLDDVEATVRKNVVTQANRRVASSNRVGGHYLAGETGLQDLMDLDLSLESTSTLPGYGDWPARPFPVRPEDVRALHARLPARFDWREHGAVSHVRSQLRCSCCWAVAATGAVEGALARRTGRLEPLSEQAIVDCADEYGGNGCSPSFVPVAYYYAAERGLPRLTDYPPYNASNTKLDEKMTCKEDVQPTVTISGYYRPAPDIAAIKVAIKHFGPVVLTMQLDPNTFKIITKGVYEIKDCGSDTSLRHAMLAVGWGTHPAGEFLVMKNSYSTSWGVGGFFNVSVATNTCGVLDEPTGPLLQGEDVLPAAA